jgi:GT2 family glycosyltransferase
MIHMDLSIVILNWKVKDLLHKCLVSIYQYTSNISFEIFVVDNDSGDGSVEMVRQEFPNVTVIANSQNIGFAAGNNQAIKQTKGDFILLLNPDTELIDNSLAKMVEIMKANRQIGVLGPRLSNSDHSLQSSVRRFPTFRSQALIMLKLQHVFPSLPALRSYLAVDFDYQLDQFVDQVMGAAFMISREVLEKVGLLDERYFIWFEEVDYCRRVKDANYNVAYTAQAALIHHGGESFAQVFRPAKQKMFNASMRKYMLKQQGLISWLGLILLQPLSMALAWLVYSVNKIKRHA